MEERYGDGRRTEINDAALDIDAEDLIPREETVYLITDDNYVKRMPLRTYRQQARGGTGLSGAQTKEGDRIRTMFVASSHDYLMFITDAGRLLWLKGYQVPEGSRQSKGKPLVNLLSDIQEGEKVTNVIPASDFPEDRYLVFCTSNGLLKKTQMS